LLISGLHPGFRFVSHFPIVQFSPPFTLARKSAGVSRSKKNA
jgi:hypothetical protein